MGTTVELNRQEFYQPARICDLLASLQKEAQISRDSVYLAKERTILLITQNLHKSTILLQQRMTGDCQQSTESTRRPLNIRTGSYDGGEAEREETAAEGSCESAEEPSPPIVPAAPASVAVKPSMPRSRSFSECETSSNLKGILKRRVCLRSLSECHQEEERVELSGSSGTDEFPSEVDIFDLSSSGEKVKKTVRFSERVQQTLYKPNSSILAQKKKNAKRSKARQKRRESGGSECSSGGEGVNDEGDQHLEESQPEMTEVFEPEEPQAEELRKADPPKPAVVAEEKRNGAKNSKKSSPHPTRGTVITRKPPVLQHQDSLGSDSTGSPPSDDSDCFTGGPVRPSDISVHLGAKLSVMVIGDTTVGDNVVSDPSNDEWLTVCSAKSLKGRKMPLNSVSSSSSSDSKDSGFENDMELIAVG